MTISTNRTNNKLSKTSRLQVKQGSSFKTDIHGAVQELALQLEQPNTKLTLVFFSDAYDSQELGPILQKNFIGPVIGCTTAGQLSDAGFQRGGICGASLASDELTATPYLIHPLAEQKEQVKKLAEDIQKQLSCSEGSAFGFLLIDGLSMQEEKLISALYMALGNVPLFGGSAGDNLQFRQTFVYYGGKLFQDAAVLTLFSTTLPFHVFKHQHFQPSSTRLVVTLADPDKRIVSEINGEPAAKAYAELIGTSVDQLDSFLFSQNPLMLRIENDYFVRSISNVEPDGGLKFFCAINVGMVLTIGRGSSAIEALKSDLEKIKNDFGDPAIIIGCDCILRRLEMEKQGIEDKIGQLLAHNKVVGFSTYGEQFNSLHVNQTFTGVAILG